MPAISSGRSTVVTATCLLVVAPVSGVALSSCAREPCKEIHVEPMTVHGRGQETVEAVFVAKMTYDGEPVPDAGVLFYSNIPGNKGEMFGGATTDENGVATLVYDLAPTKLERKHPAIGDHPEQWTGYTATGDFFKSGGIACYPKNADASFTYVP